MKKRRPAGVCPEHGPQSRVVFLGDVAYCPQEGCSWTCSRVTWTPYKKTRTALVNRSGSGARAWRGR